MSDSETSSALFQAKLSGLVAQELSASHHDSARFGVMLERLIFSTALVVAMGARGDANEIERLLRGAESYLYESAATNAKLARLMNTPSIQKDDRK